MSPPARHHGHQGHRDYHRHDHQGHRDYHRHDHQGHRGYHHQHGQHLLLPPLGPGVPGQVGGEDEEGKNQEKPKDSLRQVELLVKDVVDSVDSRLTGIFLRRPDEGGPLSNA